MTNIQAIELLKGLEHSLDGYCELNDEGKNAFRMAITALELLGISEQLPSAQPEPEWIPILDGDGQMPEVDDEGYSDYILLSFRNAPFLCIGQYREDEEGGAFYDGDDENPLTKMGLFVNAWMPLPERYIGNEDV